MTGGKITYMLLKFQRSEEMKDIAAEEVSEHTMSEKSLSLTKTVRLHTEEMQLTPIMMNTNKNTLRYMRVKFIKREMKKKS